MKKNFFSSLRNKEKKGFALLHVLIVIAILSILLVAVNSIFRYNHRLIINQERSLRAHYIAYSGAVLGYTAMLDENNTDLLDKIISSNSEANGEKTNFRFDDINADVNLTSWHDNGNIIIKSEIELEDTSTKSTIYMIFERSNPTIVSWKKTLT